MTNLNEFTQIEVLQATNSDCRRYAIVFGRSADDTLDGYRVIQQDLIRDTFEVSDLLTDEAEAVAYMVADHERRNQEMMAIMAGNGYTMEPSELEMAEDAPNSPTAYCIERERAGIVSDLEYQVHLIPD